MKVRISNQSLRIRITAAEAETLNKGEEIVASLHLGFIDSFEVILKCWNLTVAEVCMEPKKLIASIPENSARQLMSEHGYRFNQHQETDSGTPLMLQVEVDLEKA
jgi:hypothetical protein